MKRKETKIDEKAERRQTDIKLYEERSCESESEASGSGSGSKVSVSEGSER